MKSKVKVLYSAHARRDLLKLEKKAALKIVLKIKENSELSNPLERAKQLSGALDGLYRYRIGEYRAIFEFNSKGDLVIFTILRIKHRKDIYKN